jgi:hypothetical protein
VRGEAPAGGPCEHLYIKKGARPKPTPPSKEMRQYYWLFGAEGAEGEGAGVGAPVGGAAGGSEGAGVGVGAGCEVFFLLAVLHFLFCNFHWHALSASHEASFL